jgi:hypothetical protein
MPRFIMLEVSSPYSPIPIKGGTYSEGVEEDIWTKGG